MKKIILGLSIVALVACSKDRIEEADTYQRMDEFFDMYQQQEQTFVLDTGGTGPIIAAQGSELYLDSTLFMHLDGSDPSYPITIKYLEIYTQGDMALGKAPTVSNGTPLISAGEGRLRAFKDDEELLLKPNKEYLIKMVDYFENPASMSEFYGLNNDLVTNWTTNSEPVSLDTNMYSLFANNLGWINTDALSFYQGTVNTITFTSQGSSIENINLFVVFNDINSVMMVNNLSISLPADVDANLVAFAQNQDGEYFKYDAALDFSSNHSQEVTLTEITLEQLLLDIENL